MKTTMVNALNMQGFASKCLRIQSKRHIFGTMSTVAKNFRIDSELNNQASKLLEGLGLSMSQAISMFLKQVVLHRGLPFEVKYPEHSARCHRRGETARSRPEDQALYGYGRNVGGLGQMIYEVIWTSRFKKGYKRCKKRGLPLDELKSVVEKLRTDQILEEKYQDHELSGVFAGTRELHIHPDWLLCYRKNKGVLTLTLVDTGTHADLFGK